MARPRISFSHLVSQYFSRRRRKWSEESKRRLGLLCGHAGYVTGLFEYVMTDMLRLRLFALTGCALIVSFQAVQPRKQWVSLGWNSVYCAVNLYHINLLLQERPRRLQQEELELRKVLGDHVPDGQILLMCEAGQWQSFPPGTILLQEGSPQEEQVLVILRGSCALSIRHFQVGHLPAGCVVGLESEGLRLCAAGCAERVALARATVETTSEVLCLRLPWSKLKSEPVWLEALQKGFATSLASQVAAQNAAARLLEYGAVLEMACYSQQAAEDARRRRVWKASTVEALTQPMLQESLSRFREQLKISEEEHRMVVKQLPAACHGSSLLSA